MTEPDAVLKRAFAEAPQPEDDGFAAGVSRAVAWRDRMAQLRGALQVAGLSALIVAVLSVGYATLHAVAQGPLASAGMWTAQALQGLPLGPDLAAIIIAVLAQAPLLLAALAGGFLIYRVAED